MKRFHLRLTLERQAQPDGEEGGAWAPVDEAKLGETLAWLAEFSEAHLVVREDADEEVAHPHLHCVFYSALGEARVRQLFHAGTSNYWKGSTPAKGNALYSLSEDKKGNAEVYACKGIGPEDPPKVLKAGGMYALPGAVAQFHQKWWITRKELQKAKRQQHEKKASLAERLEKRCVGAGTFHYEEIVEAAIDIQVKDETCRGISVFRTREAANLVFARHGGPAARKTLINNISSFH